MRNGLFFAAAALLIAGCNTQPKDLMWANTNNPVVDSSEPPILAIKSTARTVKKDPTPASPERAAAATITEIGRKTDKLKDFKDAVATEDKEPDIQLDWRKLPRTIAVSVQRPNYRPGDRYLKYFVEIVPKEFVFSDITSVSTVYSSVDLGSLENKSERDTGAKLDPTFGGSFVGTGEISISNTDSSDRTRKLSVRVQDPDIQASPDKIVIIREGAPDRDLTGTTTSDLSVETDNYSKIQYGQVVKGVTFTGTNGDLNPGDAKATLATFQYIQAPQMVVCAKMVYYERVLTDGSQHEDPAAQTIKDMKRNVLEWKPYVLVSSKDMVPNLWGILDTTSDVFLEVDALNWSGAVAFADPEKASQFLRWMIRQKATSVGKMKLQLSALGAARPPIAFDSLKVWPYLQPPKPVELDQNACKGENAPLLVRKDILEGEVKTAVQAGVAKGIASTQTK